jgi:hypothetical protein
MRTIRLLLLTILILAVPAASFAQFGVAITIAPPALPIYAQPIAPADGYMWTPGYWSYGEEGYFWVPGTWVMAPEVGFLWTPGYWGWAGNAFSWNEGYWGTNVGFYGGVNYGFGYGGLGYQGGYWNNGGFYYNRSVNNISGSSFHNVYNKAVINNTTYNHVSYNGGTGGVSVRPTAAEETASHERHIAATAAQSEHQQAAGKNHALLASVNHGRPAIAATAKPGELSGHGVVSARQAGAPYRAMRSKSAASKTTATPSNSTNGNKSVDNKAAATRTTENKAAENRSAATHTSQKKAADNKATATRTNENKAAGNKAAAARASQNKAAENKAAVTRTNENKAAENKAAKPKEARPATSSKSTATHAQPAPRQQAAPRAEAAPRAQPASHPATTAHAQPAPHPAKEAPKPEERPQK